MVGMGILLDLAEQLWQGEVSTEDRHPFAPLMVLEEIAGRTAFVSSFANVTALDTDEGLVLIDTGGWHLGLLVFGSVRAWSQRPVHTAVYTHGHIDHVFGIERFDDEARERSRPPPRVIAHEATVARFERYRDTSGWNACINTRQFSVSTAWPQKYRFPDEIYRDRRTLEIGGETLELHHARGETDDATWVWVPSRKLLCTGDLFIWAAPNAGNPQKVQRYARDWARALRQMATLDAEVLSPGHGVPIFGKDRVKQALDDTAALLESLHQQTVTLMNEGATLDTVLAQVRPPAELLERPYLRPIYDEPEFVVRNIWRLYGGWWDGNPAHLKPARDAELAREIASLVAGGANRLAARAGELADEGEWRLACHLIEWAAAAGDAAICRTRGEIYRRRAEVETSLMAKGIFRAVGESK
jgi:alkyl sulfatase BDS1-like metallo-beta-lactamase superfamily hydrolase